MKEEMNKTLITCKHRTSTCQYIRKYPCVNKSLNKSMNYNSLVSLSNIASVTGKEFSPKHGPDRVYFVECLGVFPHNSLLVCIKVVCFWAFPTAFFTTQVKVDVRSSEVMFFNHKLLWRMAPSSKPDLKNKHPPQLCAVLRLQQHRPHRRLLISTRG